MFSFLDFYYHFFDIWISLGASTSSWLTTRGVKWKWNSGLVDHLQTSWPSGCPYCKSRGAGRRVDLVSKWVKLWLSKEHKDLGASWQFPIFALQDISNCIFHLQSVPQEKHIHNPSLIHAIHDANTRLFSIWTMFQSSPVDGQGGRVAILKPWTGDLFWPWISWGTLRIQGRRMT